MQSPIAVSEPMMFLCSQYSPNMDLWSGQSCWHCLGGFWQCKSCTNLILNRDQMWKKEWITSSLCLSWIGDCSGEYLESGEKMTVSLKYACSS